MTKGFLVVYDQNGCNDRSPAPCSWLVSALRAQVYYTSDRNRKCSLLIHESCSLILQVRVTDLCRLHLVTEPLMLLWTRLINNLSAFSGSTRFVPVLRCHPGFHTRLRPVCFTREVNASFYDGKRHFLYLTAFMYHLWIQLVNPSPFPFNSPVKIIKVVAILL